jgi:hypothetical protein
MHIEMLGYDPLALWSFQATPLPYPEHLIHILQDLKSRMLPEHQTRLRKNWTWLESKLEESIVDVLFEMDALTEVDRQRIM